MERNPQPSEAFLRLSLASESLKIARQIKANEEVDSESPYIWLKILSVEDLELFIIDLDATYRETLDEVDLLIAEWRETEIVIESGILDEFFPLDD